MCSDFTRHFTRLGTVGVVAALASVAGPASADTDVILSGSNTGQQAVIATQQNDGSFLFDERVTVTSGTTVNMRNVVEHDLDGDGFLDLVGHLSQSGFPLNTCLNDGTGTFDCTTHATGRTHVNVEPRFADFDGDGVDELIYTNYVDTGYCDYDVPTNSFSCTTLNNVSVSSNFFPSARANDFNGDGLVDILVSNTRYNLTDGTLDVCLNDGAGGVNCSVVSGLHGNLDINDADFDGDGDVDAVIHSRNAHPYYCDNDGTGTFTCTEDTSIGAPQWGWRSDAADLDGDGDVDLALGYEDHGAPAAPGIHICLNDGAANFTCSIEAPINFSHDLRFADLDCDGDMDLAHGGRWGFTICNGDGLGGYTCAGGSVGQQSGSLAIGNFDGAIAECPTSVDTDGDGVPDDEDAFPNDPNETADSDGDGVGDNSDQCPGGDDALDGDSDGVCDLLDVCLGDDASPDTDGDGVCEDIDLCVGDDLSGDMDLDGWCDDTDEFPADSSEHVDTDGDGVGDNADLFPNDPNESGDSDADGVGDNADPCDGFPNVDTDSDGVCDTSDVCPTDPLDLDDDNDNVCDVVDVCIGLTNVDSDGDNVCDDLDICTGIDATGDADADGLCDSDDNCPEDANADQADADGDTIGDVCESDTDLDGVIDDIDNCVADANADQTDLDGDGAGDVCDDDDDGDGVLDPNDNCPFYANAGQDDLDMDGFGDACDGDDDGDSVADDIDSCPGTPLGAPFDSFGCSGPQRIELICGIPADYGWRKGRYLRCVVRESRSAWREGLISRRHRSFLIRQAVHAVWWSYIRRVRRWC